MLHLKRDFIFGLVGLLLLSGCLPAVMAPVPLGGLSTSTLALLPPETAVQPVVAAASPLTLTPLLTITIDLAEPRDIGSGQLGVRYVSDFMGGAVRGEQLQAQVLPGGQNWYLVRKDQIAELVIQGTLQTTDGAQIAFRSRAFANAPLLTLEELYKAALVDPSDIPFRGVTLLMTTAPQYTWLTELTTIATYHYDLAQLQITLYAIDGLGDGEGW